MGRGKFKPAWSLVFFTVLVQAAVGIQYLGAWYGPDLRECGSPAEVEPVINMIRSTVLVLLALGLLAATFHLGRPGAARFSLGNLRTSWLSRELVMVVAFGAAVAAEYFVDDLSWLTALLGVGAVLAMARVYMIRTVPAWNSLFTPIGFLTTSLLLGAAGLAALLGGSLFDDVVERASSLAGLLAYWQVGLTIALLVKLGSRGGLCAESARASFGNHRWMAPLRIVLPFVVAAIATPGFHQPGGAPTSLLLPVVAVLLLSELLGRYLFYAMHRRVGL